MGFLLNSCLAPFFCGLVYTSVPSPEVSGTMPNSLANGFLSAGLGSSPTSHLCRVYGTGPWHHNSGAFPVTPTPGTRYPLILLRFTPPPFTGVFPSLPAPALFTGLSFPGMPFVPRPHISGATGYSNLNLLPSATLYSLALGPDLPSENKALPGNLRYSANRIPHLFSRYFHSGILSHALHCSLPVQLAAAWMLSPDHTGCL